MDVSKKRVIYFSCSDTPTDEHTQQTWAACISRVSTNPDLYKTGSWAETDPRRVVIISRGRTTRDRPVSWTRQNWRLSTISASLYRIYIPQYCQCLVFFPKEPMDKVCWSNKYKRCTCVPLLKTGEHMNTVFSKAGSLWPTISNNCDRKEYQNRRDEELSHINSI